MNILKENSFDDVMQNSILMK